MIGTRKLIKKYADVRVKLNEEIRENSKGFMISVFTNIFDQFTDLNRVVILGWTPDFNDGDPCTHTLETCIGRVKYRYNDEDYRDYGERSLFEEEYFVNGKNPNVDCSDYELEEVHQNILIYEDIFNEVYGTNFMVIVDRKEGRTVEVTEEEFHCGY